MIVTLLAVLLLTLIWSAIFKLNLAPWMGLAATGVVIVFLVARIWLRRRSARAAAARKLEEDITAQAEEQARAVRPDLRPEIQAMKAEFSRAVASLKSSKLARGGRDALAVLPWYLMIGPPGTGKSTALRNSGLKFPYLSSRGGGAVRGVGGTRNCDWWLTNDAVFLDTAGRYTTGEEDRDEWMSFLDILARNRPGRPINGLVVTVSVTDLMDEDPQAAGALGQRIRERVDEVTSRLKVVVPIYVMLTKCDLIQGFVETFADLPRSERGQIWGFTVPLSAQREAPSELLLKRFDELTSVLEQRSLRRIGQERRLETRERIYQFPQRFDSLRKNVVEFIQPLFMESVFQDTPVLRGLYFTSGTQDVRMAEHQVPGAAAEVFGAHQRSAAERAEGRSFFLWDVFNKVMFQDQKLAVRSSIEEFRLRRQRYALTAASMATSVMLLLLPAVSYVENKALLRLLRDTITAVKLAATDDIGRVVELTPLQQQLKVLNTHRVEGAPFWMRLGMYQGDRLFELAQSFYNNQLKELLIGRQHDRIKQALQRLADNHDRHGAELNNDTYGRGFSDLKMYLLITQPHRVNEPGLDATHRSWLVWQIVNHWRGIRGAERDTKVENAIIQHAEMYIAMMAQDPEKLGFLRDDSVVRNARRVLNNTSLVELTLQQLQAEVEREYPDLTLVDMIGVVPEMKATQRVPGFYTKRPWEEVVKPRMDEAFRESQVWVLDRDSRTDEARLRVELRDLYYRKYIEAWERFLLSIRVAEPRSADETVRMLTSLTRGEPMPLGKLLKAVDYNVSLEKQPESQTVKEVSLKDRMVRKVEKAIRPPSQEELDKQQAGAEARAQEYSARSVGLHFRGVLAFEKDEYLTEDKKEKYTQLRDYKDNLLLALKLVRDVRDNPMEMGQLKAQLKKIQGEVAMTVNSREGDRALFSNLLLPPIENIVITTIQGETERKSQQWCEDIAGPHLSTLGNLYPFNRDSPVDASLNDIINFYRPKNNRVRDFVTTYLNNDIIHFGRNQRLSPGATGQYTERLPRFLERSEALGDALFMGDEAQPNVRFQIRIRAGTSPDASASEIASIKFIMDGTDMLYRNGPDNVWQRLIWPGQAGEAGAALQVFNAKGDMSELSQSGEWGLFRLLERAKSLEPSPDGRFFTATWEIEEFNGALVSVDIRPERLANPFFIANSDDMKFMQLFRDPYVLPPQGIDLSSKKGCAPPYTARVEP
ncbi:type VI secretion system membrane subunit TssM [Archangium primigenium]|uniref:type VI secretion system membrane subunit TssM n=1 Tax=[Archangium] primigenium TaxID=2792470 RepID=UPI00195BAE92|nr:type VI secretion system membrane subunit TssM [Archangium primigenium]MBM7115295.1 type VI secretion system membrane subunit TssM [Archangium primigenium]